ncbi:hypothetical protein [Helicobacter pylori]|uniref:hypothetical protein n=1 Tax=Helicobacter pylori TaxID=210 RepID=UPI000D37E187|nr:hypothetical protein [Helicobacter pylori]PUD32421.1 hypothetical protein C2S19_02890 [Helicobacter pylori]
MRKTLKAKSLKGTFEKQKLSFYRNFVSQNYRFNKTTTLHPKNEISRYNVFQEFLPCLVAMTNSFYGFIPIIGLMGVFILQQSF